MPGLGHKSYLQLGKETTYGTGVAATAAKLELISANVAPVIGTIQDPSLNATSPSRRGIFQGGIIFKGTFVVRLNYEGLNELFRGAFGAFAFAQNAVGPPAANTHTFTEVITSLPSYTIEISEGDVPTGKVMKLTGAKIVALAIRGTAGQGTDAMLQAEFTVLAKDKQSNQTPSSATYPAIFPVLYHQAITIDDGTSDAANLVRVRSFEVSMETPHAEDRFYLGSVNIDEPLRNDFMSIRWRLTQEFTTQTQFDAARSFTLCSPQLIFQHPTIITGAHKREFEVRSNSAQFTEFSSPVEGYGVLISTATIEAFRDVTDGTALLLRTKNSDPTLT